MLDVVLGGLGAAAFWGFVTMVVLVATAGD